MSISNKKPNVPLFEEFKLSDIEKIDVVQDIKNETVREAYNLLVLLNGTGLQLATTESLTAGLIMSTLVNIPWAGWHKYGCFGVYDTDSKRVFNSVKVDNVYTHRCAKEMAIGLLKNSNATLAISVTGNSMPLHTDLEKLGEVFIGIAGYRKNDKNEDEIIYTTKVINNCLENNQLTKKCMDWLKENNPNPDNGQPKYASRAQTTIISILIRNNTAKQAYIECQEFITNNKLIIPEFIINQKKQNEIKNNTGKDENCVHNNIPTEKYPNLTISVKCVNKNDCVDVETCERVNVKEIKLSRSNISGGNLGNSNYKRKTKNKKHTKKYKISFKKT